MGVGVRAGHAVVFICKYPHEIAKKNPRSVCRYADIRICGKNAYMQENHKYAHMTSQFKCATRLDK